MVSKRELKRRLEELETATARDTAPESWRPYIPREWWENFDLKEAWKHAASDL